MSKYKLLAKFMYKIQRFMQEGLGFDLFLEEQELFPREGSDWHEQELMKWRGGGRVFQADVQRPWGVWEHGIEGNMKRPVEGWVE